MGIQVLGDGTIVRNNQVIATGDSTAFGTNVAAFGIVVFGNGPRVLNNDVITTVKQDTGTAWGLLLQSVTGGLAVNNRITEWGRNYGARLPQALGFTRQSPCAATLYRVLRQVDRNVFEAELGTWAEGLLTGTPGPPETAEGIAIDGQTLRGSRKQGAPGVHLLSALAQHAVADKTNELSVVTALLQ